MGKVVSFVTDAWCDDMARDLAVIADHVTPLSWYQGAVEAKSLGAWSVHVLGKRVGTVLHKVDVEPYGRCFVIVAAVGAHREVDLTATVLPSIEDMARARGCKGVRFHTQRRGLAVKAGASGYDAPEYVLRKRLA
jgi:hypothetical protein